MFRPSSLRARLILSHASVLFLALTLMLVSAGIALRSREEQAEVDRLSALALPVTVETELLTRRGQNPAARAVVRKLLNDQATEMGVRLLVLDPDSLVLYDTAPTENLAGTTLDAYKSAIASVTTGPARGRRQVSHQSVISKSADDPLHDSRVVIAASGERPARAAVAIVSEAQRQPLLRRFLPSLLLSLGVALAIASGVGVWLSRRLAAPVTRLTRAADSMAAGALEQQVAGAGPDEIGRLVASFNAMSQQVAITARGQRRLLSDLAHELRTPLTSVQGYASALQDEVLPDATERKRALETISAEAARMRHLIDDLFDLARLESGQLRLRRRPVTARHLISLTKSRFALEAEQRQIDLVVTAPDDTAIDGDDDRLLQILSNLVENALRHTPRGGTVSVSAAKLPGHAPGVRLTVEDTGSGIDPMRLPSLFERSALPATGLGLGLPIVRELVQLHGGTVTVCSEVGQGTTFNVDLPAAKFTGARPDWRTAELRPPG